MSSIDALKPLNLVLPSGFGYVGLAALGGIWLTFVQGATVGTARKKAGVAYPQMYADKAQEEKNPEARKFNCTQRAHQNTLETLPAFLFTIFIAGLKHTKAASILGGIWVAGRIVYTIGYSSGDPKARIHGFIPSFLSLMSLQVLATVTAVQFIRESGSF